MGISHKMGDASFGATIMRIIAFWRLSWGHPASGNCHTVFGGFREVKVCSIEDLRRGESNGVETTREFQFGALRLGFRFRG